MPPIKDRTGIRYSRLVVIAFAGISYDGHALWLCRCDCGEEAIIQGNSLQNKVTKSCGCFRREVSSARNIGKNHPRYIHGKSCGKYTKEILELKEKIRRRDNYICQDCSITQKECLIKYGRILDVHHIDDNDTNNVEENMITFCLGCHRKEHEKLKRKYKVGE